MVIPPDCSLHAVEGLHCDQPTATYMQTYRCSVAVTAVDANVRQSTRMHDLGTDFNHHDRALHVAGLLLLLFYCYYYYT